MRNSSLSTPLLQERRVLPFLHSARPYSRRSTEQFLSHDGTQRRAPGSEVQSATQESFSMLRPIVVHHNTLNCTTNTTPWTHRRQNDRSLEHWSSRGKALPNHRPEETTTTPCHDQHHTAEEDTKPMAHRRPPVKRRLATTPPMPGTLHFVHRSSCFNSLAKKCSTQKIAAKAERSRRRNPDPSATYGGILFSNVIHMLPSTIKATQ